MLRTSKTRRFAAIAIALIALLTIAGAAAAHPLGNFTVSRYSALTLRQSAVDVLYVVDMAEIPTFQERQSMDADGDGAVTSAEESAWVDGLIPELAANLHLAVDGAPVDLALQRHTLSFPPGQGGLSTLRLEVWLSAALPSAEGNQARALTYEDGNFAGRIGWQEIIANGDGGTLLDSSVPTTDLSDQLRNYPADLLKAPPAVNRAELRYAPVGAAPVEGAANNAAADGAAVETNRFSQDEFANLLNRTLDTPSALIAALLVAVGLGAAHALTPGHGKTIVGAYLVGSRGKARHALFLGLTTTITHTAGVFALGFLVLVASEFILPEKLYPWLGVFSGLLVVFIGLTIFRGHLRHWLARRRGAVNPDENFHFHFGKGHSHEPDLTSFPKPVRSSGSLAFAGSIQPAAVTYKPLLAHDHNHDHHGHTHGHDHTHGDSHHHDHDLNAAGSGATEAGSLSLRNLLALGISGGLLPCPSALILMLSAIALRQVGLGLVLIVAFSLGLAGVLTTIGLIMVYAGKLLERLPIRHTAVTARLLPAASAAFITLAGLLITLRALVETGVL